MMERIQKMLDSGDTELVDLAMVYLVSTQDIGWGYLLRKSNLGNVDNIIKIYRHNDKWLFYMKDNAFVIRYDNEMWSGKFLNHSTTIL